MISRGILVLSILVYCSGIFTLAKPMADAGHDEATLGEWTAWADVTPCDNNCMKLRVRVYFAPNGNIVLSEQVHVCTQCRPAPIDGHWGQWGKWTPCTSMCDDSNQTRTRACNNPSPAHGGKDCPGNRTDAVLCPNRRCHIDRDYTDFESRGMGIWSNAKTDDNFDWRLRKGATKTMLTGPSEDHTTGKGHYLYIESSIPRLPGDKARLVSPWLPYAPGGQCIKFAYSMYGRTTGSLSLIVELEGLGVTYQIFYTQGNQGVGWKEGLAYVASPPSVYYKLTFEATIFIAGYSDIAIDDVRIYPGPCKTRQ